jgi:cell wall-associated NlpC family hydrolase
VKKLALLAVVLCCGIVAPVLGLGLGLGATLVAATAQASPSALAESELPAVVLRADIDAAEQCVGIPWQLLAAINLTVDPSFVSDLDLTTGEVSPAVYGAPDANLSHSGQLLRTLGPMGFSSATWSQFGTTYPGAAASAQPDPQNEYDAIFTLADVLCTLRESNGDVEDTLAAYDSTAATEQQVWILAVDLGMNADGTLGTTGSSLTSTKPPTGANPPISGVTYPVQLPPGATFSGSGAQLVAAAETELGVPYVWGGVTAHVGLDCSGLIVVSMQDIDVNLLWQYRTSQEQATLGTTVAVGQLQPGDLLFFVGEDTSGPSVLGHVAIYVGGGEMIQAPETGEVVQFAPVPWDAIEIARTVFKPRQAS